MWPEITGIRFSEKRLQDLQHVLASTKGYSKLGLNIMNVVQILQVGT